MHGKEQPKKAETIKPPKIQSRYQVIGDIILLKMVHNQTQEEKKNMAAYLMKKFPRIKTVCEMEGVAGELRTPLVKKVAGNGTETIHTEHGIRYTLDVAKVMFSKGNLSERKRLLAYDMTHETIIDLFAGIGYFSLGIAKAFPESRVIALEKNQDAFSYLEKNIVLNHVSNITPVHADCRDCTQTYANTADRVLMGYFPHTEVFLPTAVAVLKNRGMIHFHNTYAASALWDEPRRHLETYAQKLGFRYSVVKQKIVKSVGPHKVHVVLDVEIEK
ncbi:MAG: methyltransferase [Candidatus Aenigmarchaeota archaeon]|nr:methyltransferase [Candidatus Aenigmarchaeota archaeon]